MQKGPKLVDQQLHIEEEDHLGQWASNDNAKRCFAIKQVLPPSLKGRNSSYTACERDMSSDNQENEKKGSQNVTRNWG